MKPKARWGIANPSGWYEWEENLLKRAAPGQPQMPDNAQAKDVLLVDRNGKPLVTRQPRPVGFRR